MTHEQTKLLRINLLRQLKTSAPAPLPLAALLTGARLEGFDVDERTIRVECEHLAEIEFIAQPAEPFSSAVRRFKIAPKGREWLETEGF